jgi:hypothetical protein
MDLTMIDHWEIGVLETMADSLGERTTAVSELEVGLRLAGQLPGWFGKGGDAGRGLYRLTAGNLLSVRSTPTPRPASSGR